MRGNLFHFTNSLARRVGMDLKQSSQFERAGSCGNLHLRHFLSRTGLYEMVQFDKKSTVHELRLRLFVDYPGVTFQNAIVTEIASGCLQDYMQSLSNAQDNLCEDVRDAYLERIWELRTSSIPATLLKERFIQARSVEYEKLVGLLEPRFTRKA